MPSPTLAAATRAARASTTSSCSASGTYTRLIAEQIWPLLAKAPSKSFSAIGAGVDVVEDDRRVVAAELERDPLEVGRGRGGHLLAGRDRAGEADLAGRRVRRHPLAELVAAGDDVEHAGRQDLVEDLAHAAACCAA